MFGPPKSVPGECNARLFLGDDWGDNRCTIRCPLSAEHNGPHIEAFTHSDKPVTITWETDDRIRCEKHGLLDDDRCEQCASERSRNRRKVEK